MRHAEWVTVHRVHQGAIKKAGGCRHVHVFAPTGLLANGPTGIAELAFI